MKVYGDIFMEGEITNLSKFKQEREEQKHEKINAQIQQSRKEFLDKITIAAAAAIDQMSEKGMSRRGAISLVQDHLKNLSHTIGMGIDFE